MKLNHLTDKQLFIDTKNLVKLELKTTAQILWYLKEFDDRRLYADHKCSSLFDFCVRILQYSEGSASRRIQAARLLKSIPEIMPKIESGSLSLTNLNMIGSALKNQGLKSTDESFKLKALELTSLVTNSSSRKAEEIIIQNFGVQKIPETPAIIKPVSKTQKKLTIVLTNETIEKLEKLKSLQSNKNHSIEDIIDEALTTALDKFSKPTRDYKQNNLNITSRTIPAKIKRVVFKRDHHKCSNCNSVHRLQIDHIKPFSLSGSSSAENLRLLCFGCNQRARVKMRL